MDTQASPDRDRYKIVMESLTRRRSVRSFTDQPVPQKWLDLLVEAAIAAPSGSNWQNQRFLVLTDQEEIQQAGKIRFVWPYPTDRQKARENRPAGVLGNATAIIAVFADALQNEARGEGEYYLWESLEIQNCAASVQNILTLATSLGLGSCWISASEKMNHTRTLSKKTWRDCFAHYDIPPHFKIQGVVLLGFPRKPDEEGYATGELKHGATNWRSTARKPIADYLIRRLEHSNPAKLSAARRGGVRIISLIIRGLLRIVRCLDRTVHQIEYRALTRQS